MKTLLSNQKTKFVFILFSVATFFALPSLANAKEDDAPTFNFGGLEKVLGFIIDMLMVVAPGLIILSLVWSALLWTIAGNNKKMVDKARKQFIASCVCLAIIGGYFLIKDVVIGLAIGGFETGK